MIHHTPLARFTTSALRGAVLAALLAAAHAQAAPGADVTVSHELAIARPSETISVAWAEVARALPGALVQHIAIKDAAGHVLAHQVTNLDGEAKDPTGAGVAYGELLFQYSFAPGEKKAVFHIEKVEATIAPFPAKVFARYVPERLDDFAWENDKIAHRTYGPALAAPAPAGSKKEVLVTSGLDIWFKRVPYPIVDRWYNKGHDHYHHDEGEGMDMYNTGASRGSGGTGVWAGNTLYTGVNYATWKVLANGPVRSMFELTYAAWDAAGTKVSEVKRFTVDAGHQFDQIDSTFTFSGPAQLTVAVGLNKKPEDKGQTVKPAVAQLPANSALSQWFEQSGNGNFGVAVVLPGTTGYADDKLNNLILATVSSGKPLRYYVGAAWDRAGEITSRAAWEAYVAQAAARAASPVHVAVSATQ